MKRLHKKTDKTVDAVLVELGTSGKKRYCVITVTGTKTFNLRVEGATYTECGFLAQRHIFETFPYVKRTIDDAFANIAEAAVVNAQLHARRRRNRTQHADPREMLLGLDAEYRAKGNTKIKTGRLK